MPTAIFETDGTWTWPVGVTMATIELWGGGGGFDDDGVSLAKYKAGGGGGGGKGRQSGKGGKGLVRISW